MARNCPACGRANDDDASFCQGCGAALAGAPVQAAAAGVPRDAWAPARTAAADAAGRRRRRRRSPTPSAAAAPSRAGRQAGAQVARDAHRRRGDRARVRCSSSSSFPRGDGKEPATRGGPTPAAGAAVGVSPSAVASASTSPAPSGPRRTGSRRSRATARSSPSRASAASRSGRSPTRRTASGWPASPARTSAASCGSSTVPSGDARQATADTPGIVAVDSIAWLSEGQLLVAGYTEAPKATGQNAELLVYDVARTEVLAAASTPAGLALRGVSVSASRDGARVAFVTYTDRKTDKYGMATAQERLELLDRASGAVTRARRRTKRSSTSTRAPSTSLSSRRTARRSSTGAPAATSAPATRSSPPTAPR